MKRLYYLTQHLDTVDRISNSLHGVGIKDWNFHVLSKDKAGLTTHRIHSTSAIHERDLVRSGERGALIGAVIGLVGALLLLAFNIVPTTTLGYLGMLTLFVVFTLHGAWTGGLFGLQKENYKVRQFHRELAQGQYLLMIDVDSKYEGTIRQLMARFAEVAPKGEGTSLVTPFGKGVSTSSSTS